MTHLIPQFADWHNVYLIVCEWCWFSETIVYFQFPIDCQ